MIVSPTSNPSKKTPVVQAYTFGKYLGCLKLVFDAKGDLLSYSGNPILLNSSYVQEPIVLSKVNSMAAKVKNFSEVRWSFGYCLDQKRRNHRVLMANPLPRVCDKGSGLYYTLSALRLPNEFPFVTL